MSFLYDRIITITRAESQTGAGLQEYGGDVPADETVVAGAIAASVQARRMGRGNEPNLPLDGAKAEWRIYFRAPVGTAPALQIMDRDFVTDDLGRRFQVTSAFPGPFGFSLQCLRMEA